MGAWPVGCAESGVPFGDDPSSRGLWIAPNPTNGPCLLTFAIPVMEAGRVEVFDAAGRRVRLLADCLFAAGEHTLPWDGRGDGGRPVSAGIYLLRLTISSGARTGRVVLTR
jgi:hypothetical protein